MAKKKNSDLMWILLAALFFRCIVLFPALQNPQNTLENDSALYLALANNINNGNGFSSCKTAPFYPDVVRTPVYPVFIAGIYLLFGEQLEWLILFQVLTDLLTAILIFKIGNNFFSSQVGFVAGIFYAVGITFVGLPAQIISETLFTFSIALTLYFFSAYFKNNRIIYLFGLLLSWGLSVYCKPVALFTFPLLGFAAYYSKRISWSKKLVQAGLLIIASLVLVYPWLQRNKNITGLYTMSIVIEHDLYAYNMAYLKSHLEKRQENIVVEELLAPYGQHKGSIPSCNDSFGYLTEFREKAEQYIWGHLGTYFFLHLKSIWHNFIPGITDILEIYGMTSGGKGTVEVLNNKGVIVAVSNYFGNNLKVLIPFIPWIAGWGFFLCCALLGVFSLIKKQSFALLCLLLFWGGYFIIIPGPMSAPRFFSPAAPFFCIFAGLGFLYLKQVFKKVKSYFA